MDGPGTVDWTKIAKHLLQRRSTTGVRPTAPPISVLYKAEMIQNTRRQDLKRKDEFLTMPWTPLNAVRVKRSEDRVGSITSLPTYQAQIPVCKDEDGCCEVAEILKLGLERARRLACWSGWDTALLPVARGRIRIL